MSLPRYPEYKESGVEWLGEVPAHWAVKPLRQLGTVLKGSGASKEDVVDAGVPCVRYGDLYTTHAFSIRRARTCVTAARAADYTPILRGDVLFAASGETLEDIGKSAVNLMTQPACCGGDIIILRPSPDCDPTFMGYACDARPTIVQKAATGRGTIIKHISAGDIKRLGLAVPPLAEQVHIAEFLDRETAKSDALVAEQQRLIELLKEKRQAVISHAVTKGLNPNAPMKDSGIEWLGEVPAHWEVRRLKNLLARPLQYGANEAAELDDPDLPRFVRITDIDEAGRLRDETFRSLPHEVAAPYLLEDGDVLLARSGATVGKSFIYSRDWGTACFAGYLIRARLRESVCRARWLHYYCQTMGYWAYVAGSQIQATIQNVSAEKYANLWLPVPPLSEQAWIMDNLADMTAELDTLTAEATRGIDLLTERRTALISAAVTGQIDVRGLAAERRVPPNRLPS